MEYEEYEVYDQQGNLLEEYDLDLGRLEASKRIEHHPAVEEVQEKGHWETIAEYPNGGKDVAWSLMLRALKLWKPGMKKFQLASTFLTPKKSLTQ